MFDQVKNCQEKMHMLNKLMFVEEMEKINLLNYWYVYQIAYVLLNFL